MRNAKFTAIATAFCLLPLTHLGCGGGGKDIGPTGTVEGTVTLGGKPLTKGSIVFYDKGTGNSGGADLEADGKFKFTTPIPVGTYAVSFPAAAMSAPPPDDPEADKLANQGSGVPVKYQDGNTSGITAEVKEQDEPNTYTFELK